MKLYGKMKRRRFKMIFCEAELCIYNKDYKCTLDAVEIEPSGMCYQRMLITGDTLESMPEEILEVIKKEHLKKEKELWQKRPRNE